MYILFIVNSIAWIVSSGVALTTLVEDFNPIVGGSIFWGGLLVGTVIQIVIEKELKKKGELKEKKSEQLIERIKSSEESLIAFIVGVITLVASIIASRMERDWDMVESGLLFIVVLSLYSAYLLRTNSYRHFHKPRKKIEKGERYEKETTKV